ncbi:META domain-containing protein [Nocardia australiensis]|uniref:META domain-containing protein n=1 Tax=Nocardia australiensis TaxID=2887191 RepID=UPI001D14AF6E|nr:META domain-containing protein [Nocardia australiensis]
MSANFVRFGPLLVLALCATAACGSDSGKSAEPAATPIGHTYVSTAVDGVAIPGGGPLTMTLENEHVTASAGCNSFSGAATLDDNKLKATGLAGTLMACPGERAGADEWLTTLLNSTPGWQLDGAEFTLHGTASTVHLLDKKVAQPDKSLTDTTWVVREIITAQARTSSRTIDEVKPTLSIAADGAVSGSGGCNRMMGKATIAGSEVTFQVGSTRMMCPPEVMEVENAVLKALDGKTTATIDADTLTLRNDNGNGLILHAQ